MENRDWIRDCINDFPCIEDRFPRLYYARRKSNGMTLYFDDKGREEPKYLFESYDSLILRIRFDLTVLYQIPNDLTEEDILEFVDIIRVDN